MSLATIQPKNEPMDSTKRNKIEAVNVNAHLHTPYSFSAFDKLTDAL